MNGVCKPKAIKFVANLWTEFSAQRSEALVTNGKNRKTLDFLWWLQL
jgi:hypothetical protein